MPLAQILGPNPKTEDVVTIPKSSESLRPGGIGVN
jgi:hypothetical protein